MNKFTRMIFGRFNNSGEGKKIPHSRTSINGADMRAVKKVLKSGYLSNGPRGKELAQQIAEMAHKKYGVAVSSGTTGLHMALLAVGVKAGDEVIMSSYVCLGLAQAARYIGAIPVATDVDEIDGNMSVDSLHNAITPRTRAIMIPHMFGTMANMPELLKVAGSIPVIEDCAMSPGASYQGQPAGSFGVVSVFSFYATKMMTGGEGGVVVTSDERIAHALEDLREYDKKMDTDIRYNYKMNEMSAALGISQLARLPKFIAIRQQLAERYHQALAQLPLQLPRVSGGQSNLGDKTHIYYRYVIRTAEAQSLRKFLAENGVEAGRGVVGGIHRVYASSGAFSVTNTWLDQGVSLPIYPDLSRSDQDKIISLIKQYYAKLAA